MESASFNLKLNWCDIKNLVLTKTLAFISSYILLLSKFLARMKPTLGAQLTVHTEKKIIIWEYVCICTIALLLWPGLKDRKTETDRHYGEEIPKGWYTWWLTNNDGRKGISAKSESINKTTTRFMNLRKFFSWPQKSKIKRVRTYKAPGKHLNHELTINSFMTVVPIIWKPVHWFALQIIGLVSLW